MAVATEMSKVKGVGVMSLAEMRDHLVRFREVGEIKSADQAKVQAKMKEILARLARLGEKGGLFAQVRLSDEAKELYEHSRWR